MLPYAKCTAAIAAALAIACGASRTTTGDTKVTPGRDTTGGDAKYVVVAWNDLGMHCLNPRYDQAVILPPFNTIWAQVVKRGAPPQIVTEGLSVEYRIVGNTTSQGKGKFDQFWDPAIFADLFAGTPFGGTAPPRDVGLTGATLSGRMTARTDHFEVVGVPVVPIADDGTWNPFQVAEITVKDATGAVLVTTQATVPTSDELDCAKCHGADPFADIIRLHSEDRAPIAGPVLCASCHASPALGIAQNHGGATTYLSQAIHGFHGRLDPARRPACYDCHPGQKTQCSRSNAHTAADGNCTHCHGALPEVASSIAGGRVPWAAEPGCVQCHAGVPEVDTGAKLYRNATGHGGVYCAGCHGSPHAMRPSRVASDQYQSMQYQGSPLPLADCDTCHSSSRGGGLSEFGEAHGGASPEHRSACMVCHTEVPTDVTRWPHQYGWKTRSTAF